MPSIRSTIKRLQDDFPGYHFEVAGEFWWSAAAQTVYYDPKAPSSQAFLLHELSHAILAHEGYTRDIELLKLERDAWHYAKSVLSQEYDIAIDAELAEDNLDTYRQWLHNRSTCPRCNTTGLQTKEQIYHCLACGHDWRVNEARLCALRRYSLQTK